MARADYIVGSVNVFEDLGRSQPAQALAKAKAGLARKISELIAKRRLKQAAAAELLNSINRTEGGRDGSRPARRFLARPARPIFRYYSAATLRSS